MADPADLVRAWQDAVQQLRKVAPNLGQSTLRQLIAPLQRSGDRGAGQAAAARPNGLPLMIGGVRCGALCVRLAP